MIQQKFYSNRDKELENCWSKDDHTVKEDMVLAYTAYEHPIQHK
jgi:hypothetical protein